MIVTGVKSKDQFPWILQVALIEVKSKRGFNPKILMCDNAGEFISNTAQSLYKAHDLYFDPTAPNTPEAGGLWEKTAGDVKRRSTTSMVQTPWMPASVCNTTNVRRRIWT